MMSQAHSRQQLTDSFVNYLQEPNPRDKLQHSRSTDIVSRDHSAAKLSQTSSQPKLKNQPRMNIKSNTRLLKHEIHSIDEEIAELQETIYQATQQQQFTEHLREQSRQEMSVQELQE